MEIRIMKFLTSRSLLLNAGLILLLVGGGILFAPHSFHAANGSTLGDNANLLSEIRAQGGLLLGFGLAILFTAFRQDLLDIGLWLTAIVYLSVAIPRAISIIIDGLPSNTLIGSTILEFFIGLLSICTIAIRNYQTPQRVTENRIHQ